MRARMHGTCTSAEAILNTPYDAEGCLRRSRTKTTSPGSSGGGTSTRKFCSTSFRAPSRAVATPTNSTGDSAQAPAVQCVKSGRNRQLRAAGPRWRCAVRGGPRSLRRMLHQRARVCAGSRDEGRVDRGCLETEIQSRGFRILDAAPRYRASEASAARSRPTPLTTRWDARRDWRKGLVTLGPPSPSTNRRTDTPPHPCEQTPPHHSLPPSS